MRWALFVLALSAVHCTIDREIPPERFSCERGGPCGDASVGADVANNPSDAVVSDAELDAGLPDSTVQEDSGVDAGPLDSGYPAVSCPDSIPLPADGNASGTLMLQSSNHNGACADEIGAIEQVYYFNTPGRLSELRVDSSGPGADVILYLYRGECTSDREQSCLNNFGIDDEILLARNLQPAVYYVVVEGALANVTGGFQLAVSGKIALNEPCDPANAFLVCDHAVCADEGQGFRCLSGKDCEDNLDNDFDQQIDEDAPTCVDPPTVTCPGDQSTEVGSIFLLRGAAMDESDSITSQWTAIRRPPEDFMPPPPLVPLFLGASNSIQVELELAGEYVFRHSAIDAARNEVACETKINTTVTAPLRVELFWGQSAPNEDVDADLHVLSPGAPSWFITGEDCWSVDCEVPSANHLSDKTFSPGPEVVELSNPTRAMNSPYRVGAESLFSTVGTFSAWVRIFCDGALEYQGMTALMTYDDVNPGENSFWKPARIQMNAVTGCVVTNVDTIVTVDEAYIAP